MAYNEKFANRVRELLLTKKSVEEKRMMGGLTFMVNNKMCVGILNDDLMASIDPEIYKAVLDERVCIRRSRWNKIKQGSRVLG